MVVVLVESFRDNSSGNYTGPNPLNSLRLHNSNTVRSTTYGIGGWSSWRALSVGFPQEELDLLVYLRGWNGMTTIELQEIKV